MSAAALYEVAGLPAGPLDAAARFHAECLPLIRRALAGCDCLTLHFDSAGYEHEAWRLAAVQELARDAAPGRVNAVVSDDAEQTREVADWLAAQPGITGQMLVVDGKTGGMD